MTEAARIRAAGGSEICLGCGHQRIEHYIDISRSHPLGCRLCACLCFRRHNDVIVRGPMWLEAMMQPWKFGGFKRHPA
jgi:hypothetical protein